MSLEIKAELQGMREAQRKMEQVVRDLHGQPMLDGMRKAVLLVQRGAKIGAPVDTGRLRASITPEVVTRHKTVVGIVGSNVVYAPYMELGTRPHMPPAGALAVWARRHGMSEWGARLAIARHGTKERRFLRNAFESSKERIKQLIGAAVKGIIRK